MKTLRKECSSEQISVRRDVESTSGWIMSYLWQHVAKDAKHGDYFELADATKKEEYFKSALPRDRYKLAEGETANQYCPMCNSNDFAPWKCTYMLHFYEADIERNLDNSQDALIIFLYNRLQFDPSN